MVLARGDRLGADDVPANILAGAESAQAAAHAPLSSEAERIRQALAEAPSKRAAAAQLGIPLRTLYRRIKTYGLG